jgi:hypothetical protein
MKRIAFEEAVKYAPPQTKIIYHVGNMLYDRNEGDAFMAVDNVACAAMDAFTEGKVDLFQQRVSPGVCEYIAVKKAPPYFSQAFVGCYMPGYVAPAVRSGSWPWL